ncbi:MAG: LuxR C-terminal-related transcriptional regulator [Solirubrobacteraceae bacterium]|nr:LuxR C-terminal-related transcriptional regulator [Solirubrobacteraceae bacterium]
MTVVTAPVGYGKTTAVATWFSQFVGDGVWLTLTVRDREPGRLLDHLAAAVSRVAPDAMSPGGPAPADGGVAAAVGRVVTALTDQSALPIVVVLDDHHAVAGSPSDEVVAALVDHAGGNLRVILVGRSAPRVGLARRRMCGDVLELGPDDLRLDRSELREIAATGVDVERLARFTGGWPVAADLLARERRSDAVPRDFAELFTEEVLDRVGPEMRRFLLRTSVLDRLSADRCRHLLQDPRVERSLDAARRDLGLLEPCPDEPGAFVHRPIVAAVLRERLREELGRSVASRLTRRMASAPPGTGTAAGAAGAGASASAPARRYVAVPATAPTAAEARVLRMLAGTLSLAEIGRELYLSRNTVKSHVQRLYVRLEVDNRADAVRVARERGLL